MGIKLNADVSGLNPEEFLDSKAVFEILAPPTEMDNGRDFKQWSIKVRNTVTSNESMLNFLFERQLAPVARAYGGEDDELQNWVGKHLNVTAIKGKPNKDGKVFANFELSPVEDTIAT